MSDFCCRWMRLDLELDCSEHPSRLDCPDALVFRASDGGYGLIVHDGQGSFVDLYTCPWCGTDLHDGSVPAGICGGAGRDSVGGDLGHFFDAATEDELRAASEAQWAGPAALQLFAVAARQNARIAEEVALLLAALEANPHDEAVGWSIDPIAADRWVRRYRPLLLIGGPDPVPTEQRQGQRLDPTAYLDGGA